MQIPVLTFLAEADAKPVGYQGSGQMRKAFDAKKRELGLDKVDPQKYHEHLVLPPSTGVWFGWLNSLITDDLMGLFNHLFYDRYDMFVIYVVNYMSMFFCCINTPW